jgi:starch synthase
MGYQGRFASADADWIAPDGPLRDALFRLDGMEYEGGVSFLKAALQWADRLTAVSPRYAWEITTMEGGFGLHDVAWRRGHDLAGILNGADYQHWDPAHDPHLPARYDAASLDRKDAARRALRAAFRLDAASRRPVLGAVSRLVDQKGIDLLVEAAPSLLRAGAELVVLGSGDQRIIDGLERLRAAYPDRVGIYIGFNEALAHRVVAGSDVLIVPSRYEPCGLVQMHAMRYGTIPVVRRTGGLADTVRDEAADPGRGTGFVFDAISASDLALAAHRAMILRARDPESWRALQRRAMAEDFSWEKAAASYEDLYSRLAP